MRQHYGRITSVAFLDFKTVVTFQTDVSRYNMFVERVQVQTVGILVLKRSNPIGILYSKYELL